MNQSGRDFIKKINKNFKNLPNNIKKTFNDLSWSDDVIQERIMRLGIENRMYQLETPDELEAMALATLKEELVNLWLKD